jgi:hypothetical protein
MGSNIVDTLNVLIQLDRRPGKRFVSEVLEIRGYDSEADRFDLFASFRVVILDRLDESLRGQPAHRNPEGYPL